MNDSKDNTETDIKYGYYRITVTADSEKAFVEASFYSQSEDGRVEEIAVKKVRRCQDVIVRDFTVLYGDSKVVKPKTSASKIVIKAAEIIDPVDRSSLGNYCEFGDIKYESEQKRSCWICGFGHWCWNWLCRIFPSLNRKCLDAEGLNSSNGGSAPTDGSAASQDNASNSSPVKISYNVVQIDPPHQLPIINGRILRVHGSRPYHVGKPRKIAVRIHDLKLGEFSFNTHSVIIHGVDLRVQGNKINFSGSSVHIDGFGQKRRKVQNSSFENANYILIVRGSAMRIDGVRADNIDAIRISDDCKLKTIIEKPRQQQVKPERNGARWESIRCSFKFLFLLGVLGVLTFLPFSKEDYIGEKYKELRKLFPVAVVEDANKPAAVSGKLSQQIEGTASETNRITVTSTSTSSAVVPSDVNQEKRMQGGGVITFYFGMACLLYVLFYFLITLLTFATFKAMRRHNKMTRNMSSVLEALRNERDKEKRKAMQRKILDDMINTYLDKPSAED